MVGSWDSFVRQCVMLVCIMAACVVGSWIAVSSSAALSCAVCGICAVGFFVAVSLYRHQQVSRLALEIDEVLHGSSRVSFTNCREGDIAALSNELGKMLDRLRRTSEQLAEERNALSDALADISHQIRTPLTAMTLMLPQIEMAHDMRERKVALRQLETQVDRVSWLVTTLLKLAKVDAGALQVEHQSVCVEEVITRAVSPLATALDIRDIALVTSGNMSAVYEGDARWSAEALENIIKNCMEHTPVGGSIEVEVRADTLETKMIVRDSGKGISSQDLPHLFERFYRGQHATNDHAGFGVGLSLAFSLISAQGGSLRAYNMQDEREAEGLSAAGGKREHGACFEITFPQMIV